ncbi:hypothetical protein [Acinetobacter pittii]|uniref:hypothetical protein n=1 Tax=Acinetobacter pittii TaxID=48296 RepID=UPI002FF3E92A
MDNYKIKVKDEAESKEAQELFFELGYEWRDSKRDITNLDVVFIYAKDGVLTAGFNDHNFAEAGHKELTLPQLRDLVVLKRNRMDDQNHVRHGCVAYLDSDGNTYTYDKQLECWIKTDDKPITQDPALISGDVALANVHKCIVQYLHDDEPYGRWTTITDHLWSQYHLGMFLDPDTKFKFRFKPQTIKLELELPKPFEPKDGEKYWIISDDYENGYTSSTYPRVTIGAWKTEDEIKQVVEQLRKIRGTNS